MNQKFFVLEGCEAVGKTTQLQRLEQALTEKGFSVVVTREPGGTAVGEKIRSVVHDPAYRKPYAFQCRATSMDARDCYARTRTRTDRVKRSFLFNHDGLSKLHR